MMFAGDPEASLLLCKRSFRVVRQHKAPGDIFCLETDRKQALTALVSDNQGKIKTGTFIFPQHGSARVVAISTDCKSVT